MNMKLLFQALKKFTLGLIAVGLLIFVPAGTLDFPNGWLFMALLFIPMFLVGILLIVKNPDLLKRRLNAKESESEQKLVVLISGLMFVLAFVLAGLNFRFSWIRLPDIIVLAYSVIFLLAYLMYMEVLRENEYLSRSIEVGESQKVIDDGLYGFVRHPMYTSTIFRIKNEEKVLERELDGYREYKMKVKYRIIPFIW